MQIHYALKNPAALEESGARPSSTAASGTRPRRSLEGGERVRAQDAAGSADDLPRPAPCTRSLALPGGGRDPVDPASGGAAAYGNAAGEIAAPLDGRWTEAVRERYADRVEKIIASHIEGFAENVVARRAFSPTADLEAMNVNLVGGDPYGGSCTIDQSFIWRPFSNTRNHETSIRGLYQIGASTHPGPGLSGGSGYALAESSRMNRPEPLRSPGATRAEPGSPGRIPTLGEIGLDHFAPYLLNRIVARWNADLAASLGSMI